MGDAIENHGECIQHFESNIASARDHLATSQKAKARYDLLRANAAVAQGVVYAELLGLDTLVWLERMDRVSELWEIAQ